nr:MAG TPA: hypothetical protein [Caudoviricetes sp.]
MPFSFYYFYFYYPFLSPPIKITFIIRYHIIFSLIFKNYK